MHTLRSGRAYLRQQRCGGKELPIVTSVQIRAALGISIPLSMDKWVVGGVCRK